MTVRDDRCGDATRDAGLQAGCGEMQPLKYDYNLELRKGKLDSTKYDWTLGRCDKVTRQLARQFRRDHDAVTPVARTT